MSALKLIHKLSPCRFSGRGIHLKITEPDIHIPSGAENGLCSRGDMYVRPYLCFCPILFLLPVDAYSFLGSNYYDFPTACGFLQLYGQ